MALIILFCASVVAMAGVHLLWTSVGLGAILIVLAIVAACAAVYFAE